MTSFPSSTYRLQIRAGFDLDAAAGVTAYLADLGVGWAYLSPLLRSTEGSDHGYDVVDATQVDPARGGAAGLSRFAAAAREAGLGILVDTVPNHMGVAVPSQNAWWWDVLRNGRESRFATFFDIDWAVGDDRVILPILGAQLDEVVADLRIVGEATPSAPHGVLVYFDHVLPLAEGSVPSGADLSDPVVVREVLNKQHYALRFWRDEASELNYRRFFAVTTLAGLRVEDPAVFDASHVEVIRWVAEGLVDGLRVDHPDGLVDPGAYLERLARATSGAYVLVEKILEHGETLPAWWETDGTTGYDALSAIDRVLIDPAGEGQLDAVDARLRESTGLPVRAPWPDFIHDTKRMIADTIQVAEIRRLVRELPSPFADAHDALAELLACFPVYRSYLPAGLVRLEQAASDATARRPDLAATIAALVPILADTSLEVSRRFQQTTGPVMAKGVEDTAFYRWSSVGSLTEVGGDPSVFSMSVDDFHAANMERQAAWPRSMTTLSTHDTKRGEDVRARLDVLAEIPESWAKTLDDLRARASTDHGPFDNLLYQAIVGAWPASRDRLHAYAEKAAREAAERTGWWDPDTRFEARMHGVVDAVFDDGELADRVAEFVASVRDAGWSNSLSAKLLQLAGPGVPDVYQGSELWEMSLVDPDNRRPVDFAGRAQMLKALDATMLSGVLPRVDSSGAAKLLVTSRALRLRREHPHLFSRYSPMTVIGSAAQHAIAFDRGGALAVATRLPVGLETGGGWGDTVLLRHSGSVIDVFTGRRYSGSTVRLADLLADYPVALLIPEETLD